MTLQEYYEDSFRSQSGRSVPEMIPEVVAMSKGLFHYVQESKTRFLPERDWQGLKVLEAGSGCGGLGLQLARLGADLTLLDFSPSALEQAEAIFSFEGMPVRIIAADVTHPDVVMPEKYDIIVDSHLLHCLTADPERSSYLRMVSDHLAPGGIFVAESMVYRKKLTVPDGFMFDQNNVLWQMLGKWTPVRKILDSLDLEQELLKADFRIAYFYYYAQYSFVPHQSFMDIPAEILPASVRLVLQNKEV